jgi:imidazolonepropionase-like amidohydrolase
LLGFTVHEAIIASTFGVAKLFMRSHKMGQVRAGNFADCILVDGDPLQNVEILQDHDRLNVIQISGRVHKAARSDYLSPATAAAAGVMQGNSIVVPGDFPEAKISMQKDY